MRIGVIGGGLMGLALAYRLTALGNRVHVFESAEQVGGLATYQDYHHFIWDRFYHVVLPSDQHLIDFLDDIDLKGKLRWRATQTGFFVDDDIHPLSNAMDFLLFRPLSFWDKFRLASTILYGSQIADWRRLERISVEDWLVKIGGRRTYEKLWQPLLLAKLGSNYRRVSAVFIWSYIKRMYSARNTSARTESLGYVSGGYKTVFDRLQGLIVESGGKLALRTSVDDISTNSRGGIRVKTNQGQFEFDKVVLTCPIDTLARIVVPDLIDITGGGDIEYLGVICMVVISRTPFMPYYILNIADRNIPFTGAIGMSNVVSLDETAGLHITYFPRYVLSTDPELREETDTSIKASFLKGIKRLFPDYDLKAIVSIHINRAFRVQPLQVMNYSKLVPETATKHKDLFVLNTTQFVNNTLNNNEVVASVNRFMAHHAQDFTPSRSSLTETILAQGTSV